SYFEADALARFFNARLPTEFEWEAAARSGRLSGINQVWEWTSSAYAPYPGYRTSPGAVGEYNGKFMHAQYVLRGSSFVTDPSHRRVSYRNFFPSETTFQFSGCRLAQDRPS
ncbi:MAG: SUMF1/EgtB/PvdO family nonheme iron enzyme, partial [Polyangiaceae bacterium]|nr:SUMF1/EgtB/PvdO family nonheme iron enzyme [Polyangiaceae bacterium]